MINLEELTASNLFNKKEPKLLLMLKDTPLLDIGDSIKVINREKLPLNLRAIQNINYQHLFSWAQTRALPIPRENAKALLNSLGLPQHDMWEVTKACKGLTLTDSYWLKEEGSADTWSSVNLFNNPMCEALSMIALTGHSNLSIQQPYKTPELTTQGAYAKCWRRDSIGTYLIKGNTTNGKESEAEYLTSAMLAYAGVPHVEYTLLEYEGRTSSKCLNLCTEDLAIVPFAHFDTFCNHAGKDSLKLIEEYYGNEFNTMIVIDYIIDNVDRHSLNWGLFMDSNTGAVLGLHPLFDHNNALTFKHKDSPSVVFNGTTMRSAARRAYSKLNNKDVIRSMKAYVLNNKKLIDNLFNSTHVSEGLLSRIEVVNKWGSTHRL